MEGKRKKRKKFEGMYLETTSMDAWRTLFDVLSELTEDVVINFLSDDDPRTAGMYIQTMDTCNVMLIGVHFSKKEIDKAGHYHCSEDLQAAIKTFSMKRVVRICSSNLDQGSHFVMRLPLMSDFLICERITESDHPPVRSSMFELRLLNLEQMEVESPDKVFSNALVFPSTVFGDIIKTADIGEKQKTDFVRLMCRQDTFTIQSTGDQTKSQQTIQLKDLESGDQCEQAADCSVDLSFSLKYLKYFAKVATMADTVTLFLDRNQPLVMEVNIFNLGKMKLVLASRIED